MLELSNDLVKVGFNETDASIQSLFDKSCDREYIVLGMSGEPFRLETEHGVETAFVSFEFAELKCGIRRGYTLSWQVSPGVLITAIVTIRDGSDEIEFHCSTDNDSERTVISIEYPILPNFGTITDGGEDELLKSGVAELVPMFTYVYHEYGAVRLDGWGKLVEEIGDLYFFTVARTYLWGGLYELNYEYSPMEALDDGTENTPDEHYYPFESRGYRFSPERARYLAMYADLRTGAGNKYLAYGTMLRPLEFSSVQSTLGWFHYNHSKETKEYNDSGELAVSAVLHSAWRYKDESTGYFFANSSKVRQQILLCASVQDQLNLQASEYKLVMYSEDGNVECFELSVSESGEGEFHIPARAVALLECF